MCIIVLRGWNPFLCESCEQTTANISKFSENFAENSHFYEKCNQVSTNRPSIKWMKLYLTNFICRQQDADFKLFLSKIVKIHISITMFEFSMKNAFE